MLKRALAIAAVAGMLIGLPATAARAHALLRSSVPSDGAQVAAAPGAVTLTFTEEPERSLTVVHVLDTSGNPFERGSAERSAADPYTLRVPVRALPAGVYTVTWRVVSKADGHTTAGAFAFGVGVPVTSEAKAKIPDVRSPPPSILEITGRWIMLAGLIALIGAASIAAIVFGGNTPAVLRLAAIATGVSAVGLSIFAEAQRRAAAVSIGTLLGTTIGRALVWRAIAIIVAGVLLSIAGRRASRARASLSLAAVAAGSAMLAHVAAGHASAGASWTWSTVLIQWVHVVAVGIWIGGLLAVLVGIKGTAGEATGRAVRRFSATAGVALAVVAISGVARGIQQVHSWGQLVSTGYGRAVLIKSALLLVLAALGAVNRYRSVPVAHEDSSLLRRIAKAEVVVGLVAIAVAATLASLQPPSAPVASTQAGLVLTGADFGTTVRVRLVVDPGSAGPNTFTLSVKDYDTGAPVDALRVQVRFSFDDPAVGASVLAFERTSPGLYRAQGTNISLAGRWALTVLVQRAATSVDVPLSLATACGTTAVVTPGQPTIYTAQAAGGTMQGYVDPAKPGADEVHATFFDAAGQERSIASIAIAGSPRGGAPRALTPRRLSDGHFVADATLTRGAWRFDIVARAGAQTIRTCFETSIG